MAKASAHVSTLRAVIKEAVGEERYRDMLIFCDRRTHDYRFKICGNKLTLEERRDIESRMADKGIRVCSEDKVTTSFRGPHSSIYFYVPIA